MCYNTKGVEIMYDYKYKKEYKYKQLNRKKLEELKDVIENIDGLNALM